MGDRFQRLIKQLGFKSNVAFAEKIKSSEGKVRDIIKGRVKTLSPEILEFLIIKKVDLNWLFTGVEREGGMFLSDAGNGGMAFTNEIDAYGNISQKFYQPSESKKSKSKSADVVSLEGLSESEKEHVINTVKLFREAKGKK